MINRIMHVTQCFGGVDTYIRTFNENGAFDRFRDKLLVVPEHSSLSDSWCASGGRVAIIKMVRPISPLADTRATLQLAALIMREKPDIVHLHSSKAGAIGRIAAALARIAGTKCKVVYTPHAFYYLAWTGVKRKLLLGIEWILAAFTDLLISTSPSEARRAVEEVGYHPSRVLNVSNGVTPRNHLARHTSIDNFKVIFVGRICHQKNIELLVEVVAQFRGDRNIQFTLVGVGHYPDDRAYLDKLLQQQVVPPNLIQVIPWVTHSEVLSLFLQSDVCLVTSRYESFGYVAAEAGSTGLPVVATDVDGLRDIVLDGVTGFLISEPSARAMADALQRIRESHQLRESMGVAAKQRISNHFNICKNAALLANSYSDVCRKLPRTADTP